jgi:hypothetical protein
MLAHLLILFGILAVLVYNLYGDQRYKDKLQVFLSSLAMLWLIVFFHPIYTTASQTGSNSNHFSNNSYPLVTATASHRSQITVGSESALSPASQDISGLIKWAKPNNGEFEIQEESIGLSVGNNTRYVIYPIKIKNNGPSIIAGIEFAVSIIKCSSLGAHQERCQKLHQPILETDLGSILKPQHITEHNLTIPFNGRTDGYKIYVKINRVAYWQGPALEGDAVIFSPYHEKGYMEIEKSNVDATPTCSIREEAKNKHSPC